MNWKYDGIWKSNMRCLTWATYWEMRVYDFKSCLSIHVMLPYCPKNNHCTCRISWRPLIQHQTTTHSYRSPLSPFSFSTSPVNCGCELSSEVKADSDSAAQSSSMGWDRERELRVTSPQSDPLSEAELSSREGFLKHKAKVTQGMNTYSKFQHCLTKVMYKWMAMLQTSVGQPKILVHLTIQLLSYTCTGTFWQENKKNHHIKTTRQIHSEYEIYWMTFFSVVLKRTVVLFIKILTRMLECKICCNTTKVLTLS